jgi:hypothetical protein
MALLAIERYPVLIRLVRASEEELKKRDFGTQVILAIE